MTRCFSSIARLVLPAVVGIVLGASSASAQTKAKIYIPFQFMANHQTLPAGHYTLELLSSRFLCFRDSRTAEHIAAILIQPEEGAYIETRGRLRFLVSHDRNQDRYYLTDVRFAGSSMRSRTVIQPSLAREIATNKPEGSTVDIAMAK